MRMIDRLWSTAQCRITQRMVVAGQVLLSNRILVPPSGLSYEPTQDTFASDSGIFAGHSWLAWPIFHADKERVSADVGKKDDPMVSWTHVLDSKTYSGPIVSYVPEFFTRRWKQWCKMRSHEDQNFGWQYDAKTGSARCSCLLSLTVVLAGSGQCLNPSIYNTFGYSAADYQPSMVCTPPRAHKLCFSS